MVVSSFYYKMINDTLNIMADVFFLSFRITIKIKYLDSSIYYLIIYTYILANYYETVRFNETLFIIMS